MRIQNLRALAITSLTLLVLLIVACGTAGQPVQQAEPQVVEKEVVKEVEVTRVVQVEVEKEKIVEKVVEKEVPIEKVVFATPVAGVHQTERPDWVSIGADHHYNGDFVFVHRANPGFLDLHYGASSTTTLMPSGPRFNQLLMYNPREPKEIVGDLAQSWEIKDGGKNFLFRLNDANWHDGTPVTAEDIVWSLNRMAQPDVTRGRVTAIRTFYEYQTAVAVDDKTVLMPLKFPSSTALGWLAVDYYKMYPKALESVSQDDFNCCFKSTFGSGPWKFRSWKKGDSYEYDRNDDYFKDPMPYADGMKVFIITDYARRLATLKTQQVMGRRRRGLYGFWFHWNRPPLDDPRVRKAIYLAVDRHEIAEISQGGSALVGNFFPPGYALSEEEVLSLPGFRVSAEGGTHPDDLMEAKRLLTEAGYPDGFNLTYNVDQAKFSRTDSELMADQLREKLNIDVELQVADRATFYAQLRDGTHDLSTIGTGLYFKEPETVLAQWFFQDTLRNPHNWSHPRFAELMELQGKELDSEVRRELFREMAEILNEGESHYVPIYWTASSGIIDYRMQNFRPPYHPHTIWTWEHAWWDPDAELLGPDAPPIE
ncbi:Periplasmic dipeptide transport protein [Geodia barretti]|uniref:Periplasmic dipeptide transport protein n=1 Tax=Geodia barretti TaxID=519541 RepID=A0AA35RUR1_GEOBA|nr:Periplasmic dipeptide transport protein [Geodia barretti]